MSRAFRDLVLVLLLLVLDGGRAQAQDDFDPRSVALRTALHHDPSLEAPFTDLVELYGEAGRSAELRQLYLTHLTQYPTDQGARAVHLRLLLVEDSPEAPATAREAVRLHPGDAYLHYLLHRATGDLEPLSRAIELEVRTDRRRLWIEELLGSMVSDADRALAAARLKEERELRLANAPDGLPELIGWMQRAGFNDLARETFAVAEGATLSPDLEVELALLGARLEPQSQGAQRLGALVGRLTADHPRRIELVLARRDLVDDRAALLTEARAAWKAEANSAERAVDLATLLEAEGKLPEAAEVLVEAALRLPHLVWMEERARDLSEGELPLWRDYLGRRLKISPERNDLRAEWIALAFQLDGAKAGSAALEVAVRGMYQADRADFLSELGANLLARGLPDGAEVAYRAIGGGRFDELAGLIRALVANGKSVDAPLKDLPFTGVPPEAWVNLAAFLEGESFETEARDILQRGLAVQPGHLGASLALAKLSRADEAEALLDRVRESVQDGDDYRDWLIATAEFSAKQGDGDQQWSREEARLSATDRAVDEVLVRKVMTFVQVAAERSQEARARRVVTALMERAPEALKNWPEMRRLAVIVWADDPSRAPEVEGHLLALLDADPARKEEYRLRLALLYERVRRPDLALPQRQGIDWSKIDAPALLDEAALALPDQATAIWQRLTEIRPEDSATWEKLLDVLEGSEFRRAAGTVLSGEVSDSLRADLSERVFASWQRELEADLRIGELDLVLRKVRDLARAELPEAQRTWLSWFGGTVLEQAGRDAEAEEWLAKVPAPLRAVRTDPRADVSVLPRLNPLVKIAWKFTPPTDSRVVGLASAGDLLLVLDAQNRLAALEASTGLMRWEREVRAASERSTEPSTSAVPLGDVFVAPDFLAADGLAFLGAGDRVIAVSATDGTILWEGSPGASPRNRSGALAPAPVRIGLAGQDLLVGLFPQQCVLAAFERSTGKLRWKQEVESEMAGAAALELGFVAAGRYVATFIGRLNFYRAATGERLWSRELGENGGARHLAILGNRLLAMQGTTVHDLRVDFPSASYASPMDGVYLGGDEQSAIFQRAGQSSVLELGTGKSTVLGGSGPGVVAGNDIVRFGPERIAAWNPRTGCKLWENATPAGVMLPEAKMTSWRGEITEERWQGFPVKRSHPPLALATANGLAMLSGHEVIWLAGKETP